MKNKTNMSGLIAVLILVSVLSTAAFSQQSVIYKLKEKVVAGPFTGTINYKAPLSELTAGQTGKQEIMKSLATGLDFDSSVNKNISNNVAGSKKEKSPFLGALMSLVLPGSGEFYGGNLLKAVIFLGVEVTGWGVYAYLQHKGDTKTAAFEAYADQYWSINTYVQWLNDNFQAGLDPNKGWDGLQQIRNFESAHFSHTMPDKGSQQFYELIGKYQNFQGGWTNLEHVPTFSPGPYNYETYHDPIFVNYAYTREDANHFYNYATTSIYFVVLNHLLSSADAAWTVSKYNKKLNVQTGVRLDRVFSPYTLDYETRPTLNVAFNF